MSICRKKLTNKYELVSMLFIFTKTEARWTEANKKQEKY